MPPSGFPLLLACLLLGSVSPAVRGADDEPVDLVQARALYGKELEFTTRPVRDRYLAKLDSLKRTLGSRGDARGAVAVQEEIDLIKAASADPADVAKFAGTWKITYQTGVTGQFVIRTSGSTTWNEEAGKPVQRKGRIVWKNSAFLLDFENDEDRLWRLSMNGGALNLDFYQPKATYPKGPPRDHGTGVHTAAAAR